MPPLSHPSRRPIISPGLASGEYPSGPPPLSLRGTSAPGHRKSWEDGMVQLAPEVRAFLEEPRFCVFADINRDGTPHLTVLWYELQGDTIMMNTARGRVKDKNLHRDNRVAFCVEDGYRYVAITGTCELQHEDQEA